MGDGMFSAKVFSGSGVATEGQFNDGGLDAAIKDPLAIEGRKFEALAVEGLGFKVRNRSDHVTRYWPRARVALDEFPARSSNTMIATNTPEGAFWTGQADRRRRLLAAERVAYIAHFSGDPAPGPDELALARQYIAEHEHDDAPEPEGNPLTRTSYEDAMTRNMGVAFDPTVGVGVRIKET